jgi:hypothetical protein
VSALAPSDQVLEFGIASAPGSALQAGNRAGQRCRDAYQIGHGQRLHVEDAIDQRAFESHVIERQALEGQRRNARAHVGIEGAERRESRERIGGRARCRRLTGRGRRGRRRGPASGAGRQIGI